MVFTFQYENNPLAMILTSAMESWHNSQQNIKLLLNSEILFLMNTTASPSSSSAEWRLKSSEIPTSFANDISSFLCRNLFHSFSFPKPLESVTTLCRKCCCFNCCYFAIPAILPSTVFFHFSLPRDCLTAILGTWFGNFTLEYLSTNDGLHQLDFF